MHGWPRTYITSARVPFWTARAAYIVSLMVNFLFKGIGSHWTVELDGEAVEGDYALVAVCNGRYYGGGFMPVAEARMDDGVLNTLVVKKVSRLTFMKFVNPYPRGNTISFPIWPDVPPPGDPHPLGKSRTSLPVSTASASPPTM